MISLLLLLALTIFIGAICGFVALAKIADLRRLLAAQQSQLDRLAKKLGASGDDTTEAPPAESPNIAEVRQDWAEATPEHPADAETVSAASAAKVAAPELEPGSNDPAPLQPGAFAALAGNLQANWMTWLGGGCVSLAGLFLVRYSMDQGWLGPVARIAAALITGALLVTGAEYLRRRTGASGPAQAALAGAGSITLYGALFAALKLYALISPTAAFVSMAAVAVGTMALALKHGPVLAAFGIIGAYVVPILVSTGGGAIVIALSYALVISLSALLLLRYVYRPWLYWGFVAGALGWWLISLTTSGADGVRTLYLTALAYLLAAAPTGDWRLGKRFELNYAGYQPQQFLKALGPADRTIGATFVLMALASGVNILAAGFASPAWLQGLPLFGLLLWLAGRRDACFLLPWLTLLVSISGWLVLQADSGVDGFLFNGVPADQFNGFAIYLCAYALVASAGATWLFARGRRPAVWASLATLAPLLLVTLAYLLQLRPETDLLWALLTATFSMTYLSFAGVVLRKGSVDAMVVWLFIAGHFGLAVAAAMYFEAASLTLAIAAQLLSLAWVITRFRLPELSWLFKLVVTVVIVRLTFNPWLAGYPTDQHWSLWTYGGATIMAAAAAYWLRSYPTIARWAEGAALHLFALTAWSELRYQLNDGNVYAASFTLVEAVLTMLLAAALAGVYRFRATASQSLARLYRGYALALAGAAVALYALIGVRTLISDPWVWENVSATPVFNLATLAFGAPVLFTGLYARFFRPEWRGWSLKLLGVSLLAFVTLQVRHLWSGTIALDDPPVAEGELYTYSAVWLVIALGALLAGSWWRQQTLYKAGLAVLGVVIAKLFLVDLAGLEGLLRVASFMGLGLSLLGVAYLHQRLSGAADPESG
ncbi:MAG: DUF2339 domain-containing protein [Pseudomonadota bacterium]